MERLTPQLKYFLYARKSSEAEDRQVASIDSQLDVLKEMAQRDGINIVHIFTESQSAKAPGRPVFNEMLTRITNGEAQGILCWKLDRLARNPVDGGNISWMLQQNVIRHIKTYDRSYYPTDNVLMMSVELGMANQFIRDLSVNVKRELKRKAENGWYPGPAPVGYMNTPDRKKGQKIIKKDPKRFDLIKRMFAMVLEGVYTAPRIHKIATEEWGLRMPNGKKMAKSTFYRAMSDPFYYGEFEYPKGSGNWYKGGHPAMITEEDFDRIQAHLGRKGKQRPRQKKFAYTGMIHCGECGCYVTAEDKVKRPKNGNVHYYLYYHCTKRKGPCSQRSLEIKALESQVAELLKSIEIPANFHSWAMKWLQEENAKESSDRNIILETQQRNYNIVVSKLDNLIDMRAAGEITEDEYKSKRRELEKQKNKFQGLLQDTDRRVDAWMENAEKIFTFAKYAHAAYQEGSIETKRSILKALGSNLLLQDKKLRIDMAKYLIPLQNVSFVGVAENSRLEPAVSGMNKQKNGAFDSVRPIWLPG